jgi:hypothetical protein
MIAAAHPERFNSALKERMAIKDKQVLWEDK